MEISVTKRMARNFTWLSFGDIISRGLNFFAIIYVARVLGAAAFGLLNFALAFQVYLILLVDSGLSLLGTREIAKAKEKAGAISLNIFAIRFLVALVVFLISLAVLFVIPLPFEMRLLFIGAFLSVFYRALNADWVFQGLERMEHIAISRILFSTAVFTLILLMIKASSDLVKVPFILAMVGVLVSSLYLLILFSRFAPATLEHLVPANWWDYFQEALPLGASVILLQIYNNLDTIMLGFMDKPVVVGYYNAAYKIFWILMTFLTLWQAVAYPVASKRIIEERDKARNFLDKYLRLTFLALVPVVFLITFLSSPIINLFFGGEYISAYPALQIIIWSTVLIAITGVYGVLILIPLGKSREFLYAVAGGAVLNLVLNLVLIPAFSFIGASIATLISEFILVVAVFYFGRRELYVKVLRNLYIPIFAAAVASLFFFFFSRLGEGVFTIFSGLSGFIGAYLLLILLFGEGKFLRDFYLEVMR